MRILGISSMFHDAAVCVVEDGEIQFAAHAERYSRSKNDAFINKDLIGEALAHGVPDVIVFHEKSWAKRLRNRLAGNKHSLQEPTAQQWIEDFYPELRGIKQVQYWHHETHAAAGVLTSGWDECAVLVIDAIGEFDTTTIWDWKGGKLKKKWSKRYPTSLGLFYSAITHHVGLKPMEDEYILMGMAAYGKPLYTDLLDKCYFKSPNKVDCKVNLQRGIPQDEFGSLRAKAVELEEPDEWGHYALDYDIAASAQQLIERKIHLLGELAKKKTGHDKLVFQGGVALNCVANSNLHQTFEKTWIMPNPGDAGSALGAAVLHYYNTMGQICQWRGPYLGTNIPGKYPVKTALRALIKGEIFGIANGRAEYGPRALGNRSLCADPRGDEIKDRMNVIKRRQKFRPFAPMILEEHVNDYFEMPGGLTYAPYMQYVARCKHPEQFPAIVHADGTSRVQTVNAQDHPELHDLLTQWYEYSGCPMIVNTSLNIKGQPIVNNAREAIEFTHHYNIPVYTHDPRN